MKLKLNNDQLLGLIQSIDDFAEYCGMYGIDADLLCLLRATLEEFQMKLRQMALISNKKYSLKLKPTWAFALRTAFAGKTDVRTYEGITLMNICNEIHREYAQLIIHN